ncbi:hypothetical protein Dsin_015517 [Dipteronia sinensis]|uniref:Uncharacterized protein n=1 Tax=Dipteronia sinensis TaxID=43782 RepID=A0AAE0ABZ0_9ROSI|nr:hypothetical protein Dsin_015517 [Dipteronia sinensis]
MATLRPQKEQLNNFWSFTQKMMEHMLFYLTYIAHQGSGTRGKEPGELMAERSVKKLPGCSLIEVDGVVHEFVKGDSSPTMLTDLSNVE